MYKIVVNFLLGSEWNKVILSFSYVPIIFNEYKPDSKLTPVQIYNL